MASAFCSWPGDTIISNPRPSLPLAVPFPSPEIISINIDFLYPSFTSSYTTPKTNTSSTTERFAANLTCSTLSLSSPSPRLDLVGPHTAYIFSAPGLPSFCLLSQIETDHFDFKLRYQLSGSFKSGSRTSTAYLTRQRDLRHLGVTPSRRYVLSIPHQVFADSRT